MRTVSISQGMGAAHNHGAGGAWGWRKVSLLIVLIIHWYLFSYLFNANLKSWFKLHNARGTNQDIIFPLLFSIFLSNTAATALWVAHASGWRGCDALDGSCLMHLVFANKLDFTLLCASGVVGVATTVLVLEYGSIQLVQIARSVGPLFTSLWAFLVLNQPTTGWPLVCLAATLAGTMLASWQEPSFCVMTALLMFTVNATLTFRNAATKKLLAQFPAHPPSLLAAALLALTSGAGLALVTLLWFASLVLGRTAMLPRDLMVYRQLFVLGGCNFAYNLASQLVLANVAVVSHGMLELFKRVFVLVAASLMLQDVDWQWHNILGAAIACIATAAYFYCSPRHHAPTRSGHAVGSATAPSPQFADKKGLRHHAHAQSYLTSPEYDADVAKKGGLFEGGSGLDTAGAGEPGFAAAGPNSGKAAGCVGRCWDTWLGTPVVRARLANLLIMLVLLTSPLEFVHGSVWNRVLPSFLGGQQPPLAGMGGSAPGTFVAGIHGGASTWSPFLLAVSVRRGSSGLFACPDASSAAQHASLDGLDNTATVLAARASTAGMAGGAVGTGAGQQRVVEGMHERKHRARGQEAEGVQEGAQQRQMWMGDGEEPPVTRLPPPSATAILGIYTGWIGRDNLGDEIVADIFFDLLVATVLEAAPSATNVTFDRNVTALAHRYVGCDSEKGAACDFGVLGGGSTVYMDYVKRVADIIRVQAPLLLLGSGRQSGLRHKRLNDKYIGLLGAADLVGGVRGRLTSDYLMRVGRRRVPVTRDSAVLTGLLYAGGRTALAPSLPARIPPGVAVPGTEPSGSAADAGVLGTRPLIVVTFPKAKEVGGSTAAVVDGTLTGGSSTMAAEPAGQMAVYMHAVAELVNVHKYQVVLQAVDADSAATHAAHLEAINKLLDANAPRVVLHNEYHDWAAVADLYARAAASLNSRLHSGVLAAGAGRPLVYMASNAKYLDFMASLGLQVYILDPSRPAFASLPPAELAAKLVEVVLAAVVSSSRISLGLRELQHTTLSQYRAAMNELLMHIEMRDPERFRTVTCCDHIHITRSPPVAYKSVISIECLKPRTAAAAAATSAATATAAAASIGAGKLQAAAATAGAAASAASSTSTRVETSATSTTAAESAVAGAAGQAAGNARQRRG